MDFLSDDEQEELIRLLNEVNENIDQIRNVVLKFDKGNEYKLCFPCFATWTASQVKAVLINSRWTVWKINKSLPAGMENWGFDDKYENLSFSLPDNCEYLFECLKDGKVIINVEDVSRAKTDEEKKLLAEFRKNKRTKTTS
jgi:hypothetical protein